MTPQSVGTIGLGATALGGVTSAFGSIATGKSQKAMYDYQSQVAQLNSQIAKQNAEYALGEGSAQAQKFGIKAAAQGGQIRASQASAGIDVGSGSAAKVQESQKMLAHMDMDTIRSNAAKTAYNYETQSSQFESQANIYQMAGENASKAGMINAASSIVGTIGSVSSKWLQGQSLGLWGATSGDTGTGGSF